MDLTASLVATKAEEYAAEEPLYAVEAEHVEMLPETFAGEAYGRRDVEWVVQWYFRRHLGAYPDRERRETEEAFQSNDFETVLETLGTVAAAAEPIAELDRLVSLDGVDVPIAAAFLMFMAPDRYVAVGEREWRALRAADELEDPLPDPVTLAAYRRFDAACLDLMERLDVDGWTLYRALWRLGAEG